MVVTGTGISGTVTVVSIDGTTLVLSSSQTLNNATLTFTSLATIANDAELSFYPPNDWDYDIENVVGVRTTSQIYTITADALVNKYGSADLISDINVDNFLQTTGSSGGAVYITTTSSGTSAVLNGKTYYGGSPRAVFTSASGNTAVGPIPVSSGTEQTVGTVSITGNWSGNTFANGDILAELYIPTASANDVHSLRVGASYPGTIHGIPVVGSGVAGAYATGTISDVIVRFAQTITNTADLQIGVRIWLLNDPG
jgi:hypothetical protein